MLNTYASTQLMCSYCEKLIGADETYCAPCNEYKGIMTIAEYQKTFGEDF